MRSAAVDWSSWTDSRSCRPARPDRPPPAWQPSWHSSRPSGSRSPRRCSSVASSPWRAAARPSRASRVSSGCSRCPSGCWELWSCSSATRRRAPRWIAASSWSSSRSWSRPSSGPCPWDTGSRASRSSARQVLGAGVVVVGLAMFVLVGDPDAGVDSAKTRGLVIATVVIGAIVVALLLWLRTKSAPGAARRRPRCVRGSLLRAVRQLREAGHRRPARQHRRRRRSLADLGAARVRLRRVRDPAAVARDRPACAGDGRRLRREPGRQRDPRDPPVRRAAYTPRLARPGGASPLCSRRSPARC